MEHSMETYNNSSDLSREFYTIDLACTEIPQPSSDSPSVLVLPVEENVLYSEQDCVLDDTHGICETVVISSQTEQQHVLPYQAGSNSVQMSSSSGYPGRSHRQYGYNKVEQFQVNGCDSLEIPPRSGMVSILNQTPLYIEQETEVAEAAEILDKLSRSGQEAVIQYAPDMSLYSQPDMASVRNTATISQPMVSQHYKQSHYRGCEGEILGSISKGRHDSSQSYQYTEQYIPTYGEQQVKPAIHTSSSLSLLADQTGKQEKSKVQNLSMDTCKEVTFQIADNQSQKPVEIDSHPIKTLQPEEIIKSFKPLFEVLKGTSQSNQLKLGQLDKEISEKSESQIDQIRNMNESPQSKMCQADFDSETEESDIEMENTENDKNHKQRNVVVVVKPKEAVQNKLETLKNKNQNNESAGIIKSSIVIEKLPQKTPENKRQFENKQIEEEGTKKTEIQEKNKNLGNKICIQTNKEDEKMEDIGKKLIDAGNDFSSEESEISNNEKNNKSKDETGILDISCETISEDDNPSEFLLQKESEKGAKRTNVSKVERILETGDQKRGDFSSKRYLTMDRDKRGRFRRSRRLQNKGQLNYNAVLAGRLLSQKAKLAKIQTKSVGKGMVMEVQNEKSKPVASSVSVKDEKQGDKGDKIINKNASALHEAIEELSDEDKKNVKNKDAVYCKFCEGFHQINFCPIFVSKRIIKDCVSCANSEILSIKTLPSQLVLTLSSKEHGYGVYAAERIPIGTRFGPVVGASMEFNDLTPTMDFTHIWITAWKEDGNEAKYLNTKDEITSNWCRYLRSSVDLAECNAISFIVHKQVYFSTRRNIKAGEEIVIYFLFVESLLHNTGTMFSKEYMEQTEGHCHRCDHKFKNYVNFAKHLKIFHPKGMMMMKSQCKECHLIFFSHVELSKHCITEHEGKGAFICEDCGKNFPVMQRLRHHRNIHHYPEGSYPCKHCDKTFTNPYKCKTHVQMLHSGKMFQCNICDKEFHTRAVLQRHKKIHGGQYRFSCDRCGKQCRDGTNLKVHLLTHSKVKPFQCQETSCDHAFTTKQCLQNHYRKSHGYAEENLPGIIRSVPFTIEDHVRTDDT